MIPETFYHIYNRGNNKQRIFLKRENYLFFLKKIRNHLVEHLEIVNYCLMPNHFHLLVYTKPDLVSERFSKDFKIMISSYTRAINVQENWTGSLFQQRTKKKPLEEHSRRTTNNQWDEYPFTCFHYIHQNPMKAGLVKRMEDWEMSSFQDYAGIRNGTLCNKQIAHELLEIPKLVNQFVEQSYMVQTYGKESYASFGTIPRF